MSEQSQNPENVGNNAGGDEVQATAPTTPEWTTFIAPFAEAIGKSVDEVTTALKTKVGEPGAQAIELLGSEEYTPLQMIAEALGSEVPEAVLRMAVEKKLRKGPVQEPAAAAQPTFATTPSFDVLPAAPDDAAWLNMLKTGGELKVNGTTVISAMRAALASRSGLYDLPSTLADLMETHAQSLDEPVGEEFFKLRKLLTRRSYAEIFAALEVDGSFVSEKRKSVFVKRLDEVLWPALLSFQGQLMAWRDAWQDGMANPAAMMGAFAAMAGGGGMPPGMMQPPATETLRDAAESVNNDINKTFAGVGVPIAMALAYDAQRIKEVLENPTLPSQVGAANRDQMLRMLDVNVTPDYVRLERNVTRYALAVMEYPNITSGQEELGYLTSLTMLGSQIPWDRLGVPGRRLDSVRGRRARPKFHAADEGDR